MIQDIRYLESSPTLPDATVVDQKQELTRLGHLAEPIDDTGRVEGTIGVVGPSGSGKTTIVCHALRHHAPDDANIARINCWQHISCNDVLYAVADELLPSTDVQRNSTPRATVVEKLLEPTDTPRYVILDEADQIPNTNVLYDLSEAGNLQTYLIATDSLLDVEERLDERTRSRVRSGERVEFDAYSVEELKRILRVRADYGLAEDAISDAELTRIATESGGDARIAINTLRDAALTASGDGVKRIKPEHVVAALPVETARERVGVKRDQVGGSDAPPVGDLSPDCAVLSRLVANAGEISPGNLYEQYREAAEDPYSKRHVRTLLTQLQNHNVLERRGNGPASRWVVADARRGVKVEE